MTKLLQLVVGDVFKRRLRSLHALPLNRVSKHILRKAGFVKSEENDGYYDFEL
jgi:hypothetical protein